MKKSNPLNFTLFGKACLFGVIILALLTSCSTQEPLELKPVKTKFAENFDANCMPGNPEDALSTYMEIIDSNYTLALTDDKNKLRMDVDVKKLKIANENDKFKLSDYYTCGQHYLYLVDDAGTYLIKSGTYLGAFELVNFDAFTDFVTNNEEQFMMRFEIYADYMEEHLKTPEKIKGFIITTSAYKLSEEIIEEEPDIDAGGNAGGNGAILNKFKKMLDEYIALDKKLDEYDTNSAKWDKTWEEYDALEDQLIDLEEEIWELDDEDKLSPAELTKFEALVEKFDDN